MTSIELVSIVFATLSLVLAIFSLIEVKAMQRSTHKVQILNTANQEFSPLTDEQRKILEKDPFDNI